MLPYPPHRFCHIGIHASLQVVFHLEIPLQHGQEFIEQGLAHKNFLQISPGGQKHLFCQFLQAVRAAAEKSLAGFIKIHLFQQNFGLSPQEAYPQAAAPPVACLPAPEDSGRKQQAISG